MLLLVCYYWCVITGVLLLVCYYWCVITGVLLLVCYYWCVQSTVVYHKMSPPDLYFMLQIFQ